MTAKKKRKKLINITYPGDPRDPVSLPLELCAQRVPPRWAAVLSVGFDDCPVPDDGDPGGDISTISSATKTVQSEEGDSTFWVGEEDICKLDPGPLRFVKRLFGEGYAQDHSEDVKCLSFTSKVGSIAQEREIKWQLIKWKEDTVYVQIDSAAFPEGSRASFVQLLEYAEEELECRNVVICFPADHDHRDVIVKTFMFLGFVPMRPGHSLIPSNHIEEAPKFMYMGYIIG